MNKVLASIMAQLNQISVRGEDVERMVVVKHTIRQLQAAFSKEQTTEPTDRKEHPDGHSNQTRPSE